MNVYGHRGAAGEAPENTIAGFRHAIERGVRYLELDLRLSADGKLVVIHDRTVNRTTGERGPVSGFTARELAGMDARNSGPAWPRKRFAHVPTLEAVLAATSEIRGYHLEVKSASRSALRRVAEALAERFPTAGAARRVVVTSLDRSFHPLLRDRAPHIRLGLVATGAEAARALQAFDYQHLALAQQACSPALLRAARRAGVHVAVWTVNDPDTIRDLYRMRVDSIITDYPSMALPLVSSLERQAARARTPGGAADAPPG